MRFPKAKLYAVGQRDGVATDNVKGKVCGKFPALVNSASIRSLLMASRWRDERAAAIEECARLVQTMGMGLNGEIIAAAIRTLKDKPA